MREACTCGALLVEDALFCHKCGRPVRELSNFAELSAGASEGPPPGAEIVLPQAAAVSLPRPHAAEPPIVGFGNLIAVRTALLVSVIGSVASVLSPLPSFLAILWRLLVLVAAGFLAVHLYQRRTGQGLGIRGGIRIGWLTGFFSYLIAMALSVAAMAFISTSKGGLTEFWRSQMGQIPNTADAQEALRVLESPEGLAMLIALTFAVAFLIFTALPMIGGALGAKVLEKE